MCFLISIILVNPNSKCWISDSDGFFNAILVWVNWIHLGKLDHDRNTNDRNPQMMVFIREIIPFYGRKIQVSDLF